MDVDKRAIRREMRAIRARLQADEVVRAGRVVLERLQAFGPFRDAVSVLAYIADENEVPTASLLEEVSASGRRLYLPRLTGGEAVVRWAPGEPLRAGPRAGIPEPSAGVEEGMDKGAVAFVPVVAWDASGARLGRGAGVYDRILARLDAATVRVGLAYEFQECPGLPRDSWDVPLHYVITERRTVHCGSATLARDLPLQRGELRLKWTT